MEENTVMDVETTEIAEGPAAEKQKNFTQSEVNEIIRKRLKNYKGPTEYRERFEALEQREAEFAAKESKFNAAAYCREKGYPDALADVLDVSDFEGFKEKADALHNLYAAQRQLYPFINDGGEPINQTGSYEGTIASAFSRSAKHEPKPYIGY